MSSVIKDTPLLYKVLMVWGAKPQSCETRRHRNMTTLPKSQFSPTFHAPRYPRPSSLCAACSQSTRSSGGGGDARWDHAPSSLGLCFHQLQARMCLIRTYAGLSCVATLVEDKTMASSLRGCVSYLLGRGRGLRLVPPPDDGGARKD